MRTVLTPKEQFKDGVVAKYTCSTEQCVLCDYINAWHTISIAEVPIPLTTNSLEQWGFAPTKKYCIYDYLFYSITLLHICGGFASSGIATEYREYKNKQDIVLVFKKITAQGRNKGGAD